MKGAAQKVTIYTVAARAGVSISTVSLALNAPHRVSDTTRTRVIEAATELGYRFGQRSPGVPSSVARITVAAPFTNYPSYFRRLAGMLSREPQAAVELAVHDLDSAASAPSPLLESLPARRGVDGVIVMGVPLSGAATRASREARLPVVLVDVRSTKPRREEPPTVLVDDALGGRLVGEHLHSRGHSRVAFLHEPQRSFDYVSAGMLRAGGVAEHVEVVDVDVAPGADPVLSLAQTLRRDPRITAVFANHDDLAARAARAVRSSGRRVPEDLAIVGYDDGDMAEALGLTTVRQPFEDTGRAALDLLLRLLSGADAGVARVELTPQLVVRDSS